MTEETSNVSATNGVLSVTFSELEVERTFEVKCVVDQTDFGDVVGIEILDFRKQLSGGRLQASTSTSGIRSSYDSEIDAAYVHLSGESSQVQVSVEGKIGLDAHDNVVVIEIPIPKSLR